MCVSVLQLFNLLTLCNLTHINTCQHFSMPVCVCVCPADDRQGQCPASHRELRHQAAGGFPLNCQHHLQVSVTLQTSQTCCFEWFVRYVCVSCRTGEKLQTACRSSSTADHCDRCLLCMCALDTAVGEFRLSCVTRTFRNPKLDHNAFFTQHAWICRPPRCSFRERFSLSGHTDLRAALPDHISRSCQDNDPKTWYTFHISQHCSESCSTADANKARFH